MDDQETEDQTDKQTSMILSPKITRDIPDVDTQTRKEVRKKVNKINDAKYQGMGPTGLVVAIKPKDETEVRENLIKNGIIVKQDRLECKHPWVGIPEKHTLYEIKEIIL